MKILLKTITLLSVVLFATAVAAQGESLANESAEKTASEATTSPNEALTLEMVRNKGGSLTAVVYFDAGQVDPVAAGSFIMKYPATSFSVDASDCVVDLPASHTGQCAVRESEGEVRVIFFSGTNAPLASGVIGSVNFTSSQRTSAIVDYKNSQTAGAENITMTSISLGGIDGKSVN